MAMDFQRAIQSALIADAQLAALGVQEYRGALAVFVEMPTPADKDENKPYIYVSPPISSVLWDAKNKDGLEETFDVQIWDGNSPKIPPYRVAAVSARVRKALHQNVNLPVDGRQAIIVLAGGPTELDSAPIYVGRSVSVIVRHEEV